MSSPRLDFSNRNSLWCSVLVETLVRRGLTQAVLSPGSRSTPLTLAFAAHPAVEAIPVLDERSAAFFALGLAKQQGRPVVLVCTSGTAAANYFPAIIEASEAGVPLLVLTADRPPELRDCSSGQTIDQQKLFGAYVRFHHEFAVPEPEESLFRYLRQTLVHAHAIASAADAGPVHLNCPFRDPLHPAPEPLPEKLRAVLEAPAFWQSLEEKVSLVSTLQDWPLPKTQRGLIIAGPSLKRDAETARQVGALSAQLGWPVLADVLSPLRHHANPSPVLVTHYDALLRSEKLSASLRPEAVLIVDGLPTSKVLRKWLEAIPGLPMLLLSSSSRARDALHGATIQSAGRLDALISLLGKPQLPGDYAQAWRDAEDKAGAVCEESLRSLEEPFEGKAAWILSRVLPSGTPLFVANSMPVRDLEYLWEAGDRRVELFFNRGANGIDGTLSSALGAAHGNRPALLLTGDLSLLHDTNGFLLASKFRGSLSIVLINNNGGGIFEHLPVAGQKEHFETYFATPQTVSFADLARAYGVEHKLIRDWGHLASELAVLPERGMRILELNTDRREDAAFRKRLFSRVAEVAGNS